MGPVHSAATLTAGTAAVSFAHLHADFTNTGASYPAIPGAVVSASGFLSPTAGSFVELAEQGTITIKNSSGQQVGSPDSFTMIAAFGYNSSLQFSSFVSGTGQMTLNAPNSQEDFSLTGTDLFGLTNITSGMGFSVDASLTLVSDPGSLIQLSSLSDVPKRVGPDRQRVHRGHDHGPEQSHTNAHAEHLGQRVFRGHRDRADYSGPRGLLPHRAGRLL
ncbi:MAG: hypothetical protein ACXVA6_17580 [Isosphaeraceae bacterium]